MSVKTIFVVGAGLMGSGIAQSAIAAGYAVILNDQSESALKRAEKSIVKGLEREMEKGRMSTEDYEAATARLAVTSELSKAGEADLVIEAIFENLEAKQDVFEKLENICPD